jgi:hypothetical protein
MCEEPHAEEKLPGTMETRKEVRIRRSSCVRCCTSGAGISSQKMSDRGRKGRRGSNCAREGPGHIDTTTRGNDDAAKAKGQVTLRRRQTVQHTFPTITILLLLLTTPIPFTTSVAVDLQVEYRATSRIPSPSPSETCRNTSTTRKVDNSLPLSSPSYSSYSYPSPGPCSAD